MLKLVRHYEARRLVEGVGAGSPVGEEHAESDSLERAGKSTNGNGVHGALLSEDLGDNLVEVSVCLVTSIGMQDDVLKERQRRRR